MVIPETLFKGKKVLVTGHTGFKGAWLCEWLKLLDADVHGYSLDPPSSPSLFQVLDLEKRIHHHHGDILAFHELRNFVERVNPDFVFHLAAQPLVRASYKEPLRTFNTNVMGTLHLLESIRLLEKSCVAVLVTTDKCYENREWVYGYREEDPLGGHDPYSASKAACEMAISSYQRSFFGNSTVRLVSARAGNVIGGGDWAADRIVPDCIRALSSGKPITVRNKHATRPWQHVLEALGGYLSLAAFHYTDLMGTEPFERGFPRKSPEHGEYFAFNFGPELTSNRCVRDLVEEILRHWPGRWKDLTSPDAPHEAGRLNLVTDRAFHLLGWKPKWNFEQTIQYTIEWYRSYCSNLDCHDMQKLSQKQIKAYMTDHP